MLTCGKTRRRSAHEKETREENGTDPIGYRSGDGNLYRYAKNGPVTYVDPAGTDAQSVEACKFRCRTTFIFCSFGIGKTGVGFIACVTAFLACLDSCEEPPPPPSLGGPRKITGDSELYCYGGQCDPMPTIPISCSGTCTLTLNADGSVAGNWSNVNVESVGTCPSGTAPNTTPADECNNIIRNKCIELARAVEQARAKGRDLGVD